MNFNEFNPDLVWKLAGFNYPESVVEFLKRFEKNFCVFSSSVRQLYSNYEMQRTAYANNNVIVLPNPFAYHDNFYNIPEEAILPTGMFISPGEVKGKQDWVLCYRDASDHKWKGRNVAEGIEKFRYKYGDDDPFLPVLLNSDLRKSSSNQQPLMHLHRISIKHLKCLSAHEREDITRTINSKLSVLAA